MLLSFGDCTIDMDRHELCRLGAPVAMEPQVFDVLAYLTTNDDRLVTKEELLDEVWGDRFVSESALTTRIKAARQAIGDDGRAQRHIKTIHGRGYRFVSTVSQVEAADAPVRDELHNLPSERSVLFGRDEQISLVAHEVLAHRLVTLLGIGGMGKTRLAVATARSLLDNFPDGIWFVDLTTASDADWIVTAMADAAGLSLASGEPLDSLGTLIDTRQLLFVLDNCETATEAAAAVVDTILDRTEGPQFLVTSREPLDLVDEYRFAVEPLAGDWESAVALFRAAAARFGADLSATQDESIARVCEQLDGLPLAIELAAGQLRHLTVDELAHRLDRRFELLVGGNRRNQRQESLSSVLEDTWEMLNDGERTLIYQLAAFPGDFALVDIEEVTLSAAQAELGGLVDRSLVTRTPRTFKLLDSVRMFAKHRDPEPAASAERHADWSLARLGDSLADHYYSYAQLAWCGDHFEDIRTAYRHFDESDRPVEAARVIAGTGLAMHMDLGARARWALRRIDACLEADLPVDLQAELHIVGVFSGMASRDANRIAHHGRQGLEAAETAGPSELLALTQVLRSWSMVFEDRTKALDLTTSAAEMALDQGDQLTADVAIAYHANHMCLLNRYDEAATVLDGVIDRYGDADVADAYGLYVALVVKTGAILMRDPAQAAELGDRIVDHPTPNKSMVANQILVASARAAVGDVSGSVDILEKSMTRLARATGESGLPDVLIPAAMLAVVMEESERARETLRAIRESDLPTQSFQNTIAFRMLRDEVGMSDHNPLDAQPIERFAEETFEWMRALA